MVSEPVDLTQQIQDMISAAAPRETVYLPTGEYKALIYIDKSLTLCGQGKPQETVVSGKPDTGSVIIIEEDDLNVTLGSLTIAYGLDMAGGGIMQYGNSRLELQDCIIRNNGATYLGGGGIYVEAGELLVLRTKVFGNIAQRGGGIFINNLARAVLKYSLIVNNQARFGGGICVQDGASVTCIHCTFADNLTIEGGGGDAIYVSGTTTRQPTMEIVNSLIASQPDGICLVNSAANPGQVMIHHSLLPHNMRGSLYFQDSGHNLYDAAIFQRGNGKEYIPAPDSPGTSWGDPSVIGPDDVDFAGWAWSQYGVGVGALVALG